MTQQNVNLTNAQLGALLRRNQSGSSIQYPFGNSQRKRTVLDYWLDHKKQKKESELEERRLSLEEKRFKHEAKRERGADKWARQADFDIIDTLNQYIDQFLGGFMTKEVLTNHYKVLYKRASPTTRELMGRTLNSRINSPVLSFKLPSSARSVGTGERVSGRDSSSDLGGLEFQDVQGVTADLQEDLEGWRELVDQFEGGDSEVHQQVMGVVMGSYSGEPASVYALNQLLRAGFDPEQVPEQEQIQIRQRQMSARDKLREAFIKATGQKGYAPTQEEADKSAVERAAAKVALEAEQKLEREATDAEAANLLETLREKGTASQSRQQLGDDADLEPRI